MEPTARHYRRIPAFVPANPRGTNSSKCMNNGQFAGHADGLTGFLPVVPGGSGVLNRLLICLFEQIVKLVFERLHLRDQIGECGVVAYVHACATKAVKDKVRLIDCASVSLRQTTKSCDRVTFFPDAIRATLTVRPAEAAA